MRVEVIRATESPVEVISLAAGICYGKTDVSEKRVRHCFNNGHLSVFEHASVTVRIEGISRACMAQLTRHRHASFCVESQRYNKYDLTGCDWFVIPPTFAADEEARGFFEWSMYRAAGDYKAALMNGVKPEDARYLLPEATKTNLEMTCNLRELYHVLDMRCSQAAQWEIRELATAIALEVSQVSQQWGFLMGLWVK